MSQCAQKISEKFRIGFEDTSVCVLRIASPSLEVHVRCLQQSSLMANCRPTDGKKSQPLARSGVGLRFAR